MPRKSTQALSVITNLPGTRLEPPARLKAEPATIWREIVATKPYDWFNADSAHLLEAFCHATVSHRLISARVSAFTSDKMAEPGAVPLYDQLTRLQERQTRVMAMLLTRLRLTQQSRYSPRSAATAANKVGAGSRPWDA